jgi:hypothetical protein
MRRLARHLFTLCSAVSLLLCVAVCVLWLQGHRIKVALGGGGTATVENRQVEFKWIYEYGELLLDEDWTQTLGGRLRTLLRTDYAAYGFRMTLGEERRGDGLPSPLVHPRIGRYFGVGVPLWFVAVMAAPLPMGWLLRRRVKRRQEQRALRGRCVACGYDLRASPDCCPECGTPAAK